MKKTFIILAAAAVVSASVPLAACKKDDAEGTSKYVISATYDDKTHTLSGVADFTFYNSTDNEISDLQFNLWGNAFRRDAKYKPVSDSLAAKAYYAGSSYGGESVEKVEGCASWEVGGEDENILNVVLNSPVYPDQTAKVSITYTLDMAKINHRTGVTADTVNLGNFYPILCAYSHEGFIKAPYYSSGDPFVSDCADYDVSLTLPQGYAAATSGKEVARTEAGDTVTTRYELKCGRDFAAVLSDKFKTVKRDVNGCEVTVYYCGEAEPRRETDAACESLDYYSKTFGAYAYPTLSVVFTPLYVSGMEYPALTMINSELGEADAVYTIAHENAHQWWYAMVGNDQINCAWQDEGLAEYSTLCFFENHPAYGYTRTQALGTAVKAYRAYYSVYNQIFGKADTTMTRSLGAFASEYEYVNIAYNKGLLMFEAARSAMGDKKFFAAAKSYFNANRFKIASPEELVSRFSANHDLEGLFASYIDGKVVI
ncbi:MAG: M1 family metallopeptidase [Clostridiales bacterium]|nr:M1 family metallopeptidase [Clostridiales bacterium]